MNTNQTISLLNKDYTNKPTEYDYFCIRLIVSFITLFILIIITIIVVKHVS